MRFETYREAEEWVSDFVGQLGSIYDGYVTPDPKVAQILTYELAVLHASGFRSYKIFAHQGFDKAKSQMIYRVWVVCDDNDSD